MDTRPQIGPEGRGRPLIVALDHVDAGALPLVGGKAANLGELIAAGLPVPAGFCVTTEAYRDVATAASTRCWTTTARRAVAWLMPLVTR